MIRRGIQNTSLGLWEMGISWKSGHQKWGFPRFHVNFKSWSSGKVARIPAVMRWYQKGVVNIKCKKGIDLWTIKWNTSTAGEIALREGNACENVGDDQ